MITIVLDPQAANMLRSCAGPAVLRDSEGQVLGFFEPPQRLYAIGEVPEFDEAELDRREQRWEGIPSVEVRKRLQSDMG